MRMAKMLILKLRWHMNNMKNIEIRYRRCNMKGVKTIFNNVRKKDSLRSTIIDKMKMIMKFKKKNALLWIAN
jgi:hypothetical protein